jgi:WD40 repeat protein
LGIITWSPDGKDQREFPRYTNFGLDAYLLGFVAGHSQIIVSPTARAKDPDEEERVQQNAFSVVDAETGNILRDVPGPNPGKTFRENIAHHLSVSSDQRLAAVIYNRYAGRSIGIYSTLGWERIAVIDLGDSKQTPDPQAITFSPDGKNLAVAHGDNSHVDIFEVGSWKMLRSIEAFPETPPPMHVLSLGAIAFNSNGSMIAVASRSGGAHRKYTDGTSAPIGKGDLVEEFPRDPLRVFRVDDGSLVASTGGFPGGLADEYKLAWSPTGQFIAFLDTDRNLRLWNPKYPSPPAIVLKLEHSAGGIAFSPDGSQLAVSFADGVKIFDVISRSDPQRKLR